MLQSFGQSHHLDDAVFSINRVLTAPPCGVFSDPGLPWDAEHGEKQGSPLPIKLGLGYYEAFATLFPPLAKLDCSPFQMAPVYTGTSLPHSSETKKKPQLAKCSAACLKD